MKGVGGAVPILNKGKALLRWMVSEPEVATILSDFEPSFANKKADLHGLHHDEGVSTQHKTDVLKLTSYWSDRCNPFNEDNGHLINIYDRTVAPPEVYECISNLESLGKKQYQKFVRSVFITKEKSVWDKIPMTKPKLFGSSTKSKATAQPTALTVLKKNSSMFMRLILNAQCPDGDVGTFFSSEPFDYPPSLLVNGSLRFGCKSDVLKILFLHQKSSKEYFPPCIQARAFDAAAPVQSLGLKESVKSFKDYKLYFWNYIKKHSVDVCSVDIVFDCYLACSLKSYTRIKRGTSSVVAFTQDIVLPKNWHGFLSNSKNKTALFK